LTLINDILDFSKIEAGKMTLECVDFEPRPLMEEVVELLAKAAHEKDLELLYWFEEGIPLVVKGDPTRLHQILTNLVNNAIKFTESGEITVWANRSALRTPTGALCVRFNVKDTGIGIPPERTHRLFKAFSQVDGSNTRRYGGTGLGLTISKELSELMGGTIGVESEPGKGSHFWFTVRLFPSTLEPAGSSPLEDLKDIRALIVDDNPTNRRILTLQAKGWRMISQESPDGESALTALRRAAQEGQPFQLAILDMQMPGMDGLDLAKHIKADPALRETRLVMLTSMGHPGQVWAAREIGVLACLTKPVRQTNLYDCLLGVLSGIHTPTPTETTNPPPPLGNPSAHILLVEDNPINQKVARMQLQKLGFEPDLANHGREALEKVSKGDYHLVLCDCQMPEMDGFAATREIRRLEQGTSRHIPIVAMTANAMKGDRERCLEAGMDDYISKPVQMEVLAQTVRRWLHLDAPTTASPQPSEGDPADATPAPSPSDEAPYVSMDGIDKLRGLDSGEGSFLKEVITLFLEDTPPRLLHLRNAVTAKDLHQMEREAHTLKGSTGNLGAQRMHLTCVTLVQMARAGVTEGALTLVDRLDEEYAATTEALKPLMG
jgi:CheY-like chemotaxis protein/HPt (histidine-containing phosphotransfer) domain-containing protein